VATSAETSPITTTTTTTVVKKRTTMAAADSPLRRSILETNEADDSSAAEDVDERRGAPGTPAKHSSPLAATIKRDNYGEVQLTISYDTSRNKLCVKVNQARDLINTDKDSLSDPYARVILLPDRKKRTKRKTRVVKDSLTPVWDEQFEFDVSMSEARTKTIDLVVKNDKSLFSREKTFMGECLISLEALFDMEIAHTEWYKLQDHSVLDSLIKKIQE
jgi:hypothetical protein